MICMICLLCFCSLPTSLSPVNKYPYVKLPASTLIIAIDSFLGSFMMTTTMISCIVVREVLENVVGIEGLKAINVNKKDAKRQTRT